MKRITDKDFRYATAEESRAPGYLARKFKRIAEAQKREQEQTAAVVRPLKTAFETKGKP